MQKFAEGYLKVSKSDDPLVEQIIQDILAQQKQYEIPVKSSQQTLMSTSPHKD